MPPRCDLLGSQKYRSPRVKPSQPERSCLESLRYLPDYASIERSRLDQAAHASIRDSARNNSGPLRSRRHRVPQPLRHSEQPQFPNGRSVLDIAIHSFLRMADQQQNLLVPSITPQERSKFGLAASYILRRRDAICSPIECGLLSGAHAYPRIETEPCRDGAPNRVPCSRKANREQTGSCRSPDRTGRAIDRAPQG